MKKYQDASQKNCREYQYSLSETLNPESNGGEAITLVFHAYDNGDLVTNTSSNIFYNTELTMYNYGNGHASINLGNVGPQQLLKVCLKAIEEEQA